MLKNRRVNALKRVSIRIPHAHKEQKERKIILGEQKKIMNNYVLPHFQEFRNFNQAFDEATLDRETGRRTSFIKTNDMNKILLQEMLQ